MRAAPVLRAVAGGVTRRQAQTVVIGLVVIAAAAAALALGPRADPSAPLARAFAARHGSEVTATSTASPAQLAATTGLAGVTAAAGPFPETTVTATMLVTPPPGQSATQQMTVVGRASPGGPVDDLTLHSGHWATQPILRLRYQGSADCWAIGIFLANSGQYTESELPASFGPKTGTPEEGVDDTFVLYAGTESSR
jgi:hypothetical protein